MPAASIAPVRGQGGICLVRMENAHLRVDIAPTVGGKIVSLTHKPTGHEFLWRNSRLELARQDAGAAYDPNFYGGVDELLPNDCPETLAGVACPDHGELWTTAFAHEVLGGELVLRADLAYGLRYERRMALAPQEPSLVCRYTITNLAGVERPFLWKLHAALAIQEGDRVVCPAAQAVPLDLDWTRCREKKVFAWPVYGELDMSTIPACGNSAEFLALSALRAGTMRWERPEAGLWFEYRFDTRVFPYCWYFASFGKFDGHYVAILEPCTCGRYLVAEAATQGLCSRLAPGESLRTTVTIAAGKA
jgi:hypothetical protein